MRLSQEKFIFSNFFKKIIKSEQIVLADVGARGDLNEPWEALNQKNILSVIGFEPDEKECSRLNALRLPNRLYVPIALWSMESRVNLHLAKEPLTSSSYPLNLEVIKKYEEKHWKSRITEQIVTVNSTTLDKVLVDNKLDCDFLKIDAHGAEFEILEGAVTSLKKKIFGVLVETWTEEIHAGQRLTGDILKLMAEIGFSLFDINVASAWRRQIAKTFKLCGKAQIIGLDLLFFKKPEIQPNEKNCTAKIIKAAAIAELYGFPDYAIELLTEAESIYHNHAETLQLVKNTIIHNSRSNFTFLNKFKRKLYSIFGIRIQDYPSLHY